MTQINIGVSEQNRQNVAGILEHILADEYVLYTKTRNYHWNVVGPHFNEYHETFEEQYDGLADDVDEVAERIRFLGFKASSTLSEFQKNSQLKEHPGEYPNANTMVSNLLEDHETIIKSIREKASETSGQYGDAGTEDFLIGLMQKHEKTAWMLRSILE
ncbi:MAG: DNA starvation/stationary phase protection protein [Nitrosopumilus sp.]|nr:DNA starvation/stationary phase protection protein [Nitrosopumilus sp.]